MLIDSGKLEDWANILSIVSILLTLTVTYIVFLKKKLSETKLYKNVRDNVKRYYLQVMERKFYMVGLMLFFIGVVFALVFLYSIYNPPHSSNSYTYYSHNFIQPGQIGVLDLIPPNNNVVSEGILINKGQEFIWKRGWSENTKLKRFDLNYYTRGTEITINIGGIKELSYPLNGTETLKIENISLPYETNKIYFLVIKNIGNAPFYVLSMGTDEEHIATLQEIIPYALFAYISILLSIPFFIKHKNRTATTKVDLFKEAKLADRIKNIELELECNRNMLKSLEELNLKGDLSPNIYSVKKESCEENINLLFKEKEAIALENVNIFTKFNKELR